MHATAKTKYQFANLICNAYQLQAMSLLNFVGRAAFGADIEMADQVIRGDNLIMPAAFAFVFNRKFIDNQMGILQRGIFRKNLKRLAKRSLGKSASTAQMHLFHI